MLLHGITFAFLIDCNKNRIMLYLMFLTHNSVVYFS